MKTTTTVRLTTIATTEIQTTIAPTAPSQEVDENIKARKDLYGQEDQKEFAILFCGQLQMELIHIMFM